MIEANPKHKGWRGMVAAVAHQNRPKELLDGPVRLTLTFQFIRPASAKKRQSPCVKPDLSKLVRCVEDSLTGIVFRDDALVVDLIARKVYADCVGVWVMIENVDFSGCPDTSDLLKTRPRAPTEA
jgi:Holliday junction resolvase RusA-like endonuclease